MDVELPNGTVIQGVPDGISKADLVAKLKANGHDVSGLDAPPAAPQGYWDKVRANVNATAGEAQNLTLGAGRGAGEIGATILAPLDYAARKMGVDPNSMVGGIIGRDDRRQAMTGATQEMGADPQSLAYKAGKLGTEVAGTAGAGGMLAKAPMLAQAAPRLANALRTNGFTTGAAGKGDLAIRALGGGVAGGAQVGLVDPSSAGSGAAIGAALPVALRGAGALGSALAGTPLSAEKQAAVDAARQAGFKLPPTEMNPSALNSIAEGLSGKIKTSQAASQKNQPVVNQLAAKALGLDPELPITPQVLDGVRKTAGRAYEALKGTGTVTADAGFGKALDGIVAKYKGAAADFPGLVKSEVPEMIDALRQKSFSASGAVDAIGVLRDAAKEAFAKQNTGLGKAAKAAADELEGLMGRHLEATGADPALIKQFQEARATIAKSYSVGKALNQTTGDVSATSLASQKAKGKPLTNELDTIAQAAQAFPKAMQSLPQNYNALSPLDFAVGAVAKAAGVASGNVGHLAIPFARPLVRGAILSDAGQKFAARGSPRLNALAGPAVHRALPRAGQQN